MLRTFENLLKQNIDKENLTTTHGQQIHFNLEDYQLPTVSSMSEVLSIINELINDTRYFTKGKKLSPHNRQWRCYGANEGMDQLNKLCEDIMKKVPNRRLLLVTLDPRDRTTLPLTQCLWQFFVSGDTLSCKVYQSSAIFRDVIRYDSCRAALLTYMLCHICGLLPGSLIHSFGSLLIDSDTIPHVDHSLRVVMRGKPLEFNELSIEDFELQDYFESEKGIICVPSSSVPVAHEEMQYLDLIGSIIKDGTTLMDRTGVGTRSIFGQQMVFSLRNGVLPLLTTKRVFFRGILEELLWFLRGSTNGNELADKNVRIWDANGSKEFLTNAGLGHREVGDLGPIYGFQWRHFGARYGDMFDKYTNEGVDQIANVIESIRTNPSGANHIVLAWNVNDIPLMALPPCHCLVQFFVSDGELSCKLYQRSGDMGLGVPFNIASYAFLTHMVAHVTGLKPGHLIHTLGDAHVYLNHIEPLKTQLQREPLQFPTLRFAREVDCIDDFSMDDFLVDNYNPHPKIAMDMAV